MNVMAELLHGWSKTDLSVYFDNAMKYKFFWSKFWGVFFHCVEEERLDLKRIGFLF